ncbi:uncharacterized protein OCT59_006753 [Rhizophagus irregularis]|uniref:uncharacterized protein n=1 Tax=Rhizophagus irregularis TaxID=588596 RepID=UPI00331CBEA9|nr:hypothetical protein OCT59_006753 [Rhizophagus irregularis]
MSTVNIDLIISFSFLSCQPIITDAEIENFNHIKNVQYHDECPINVKVVYGCSGDACLELNFGLGYKGDALPDLDFIKVTPFLDLDFGDALPGPGFRLGLLKRTPLGPGFRQDPEHYIYNSDLKSKILI